MRLRTRLGSVPGRVATGGYILHSGLAKWHGSPEQAAGVYNMAVAAYPFLKPIPPSRFLRLLATTEIAAGTATLLPLVPDALVSGGLLTMYARTPALRMPGSIWPSPSGIAVSKDVWMFGVGMGLMVGARWDARNGSRVGYRGAPEVEATRV